jgi:hypothetical protein
MEFFKVEIISSYPFFCILKKKIISQHWLKPNDFSRLFPSSSSFIYHKPPDITG